MVLRSKAISQAALWLCVLPVLPVLSKILCETGWTFSPAGTCIKVYDEQKSWLDAHRSCQSEGAELMAVLDLETFKFVKGLLGPTLSSVYILIRKTKANTYTSQIEENEDENAHPDYLCGLVPNSFRLKYISCKTDKNYICEKSTGYCPDQWITSAPSGTCIRIFTGNKSTWAEARKICQSENGDLVTILDKNTNELIGTKLQILNEQYAYIGLNDQRQDGTFQWLDFNDEVKLFIWDVDPTGQPSPQKNCTLMKTWTTFGNSWIIADCEEQQAFVCEMFSDCENKKFGMLCPLDCGATNCAEQACNPRTGFCQEGCISGFAGCECDLVVDKSWTRNDLKMGRPCKKFPAEVTTNVTQSPEEDKNFTKKQEEIDQKAPSMITAYLVSFLFAAVMFAFLMIPQCKKDTKPNSDVFQEGEGNIKAEYFADTVVENFPDGESSVNIVQGDPTFSRTKVVQPNQSVNSVTRVRVD